MAGIWYVVALLAIICVTFLLLKRPIYECMFYGYVGMVVLTGEYANFFSYIGKTSQDTLFYSIVAFLVLAKILDATKAIDTVVNIIIATITIHINPISSIINSPLLHENREH